MPEVERRHLSIIGATRFLPLAVGAESECIDEARETCSILQSSSASYLTVVEAPAPAPGVPDVSDPGQSENLTRWRALTRTLRRIIAIATDHDLKVAYHPHVGTSVFREQEIDRLISELGADGLQLCIDTAHSVLAGIDPIALHLKHETSVAGFHFRDAAGSNVQEFRSLSKRKFPFSRLVRALQSRAFNGWVVLDREPAPRSTDSVADFLKQFGVRQEWLR